MDKQFKPTITTSRLLQHALDKRNINNYKFKRAARQIIKPETQTKMNGPQLPKTPKTTDNTPIPCATCENATEEGPKNPQLCDNCSQFQSWQEKECSTQK